jgi:acetoin:2,6-dichlorophenolindophenol oxidoreductase subunit alpha
MTYRGHGPALARGMDMTGVFAELFGRRTGVSLGMGGSMHLTDPRLGLIGCFAIVGAGLPVALGAAMSSLLRGDGRVSVTFFGDGATNIGTFHETMNMASVWHAPVVFVCENNLYGEYSPIRRTTPIDDLAERAGPYRIPSAVVDGNDVEQVFSAASTAVKLARSGGGPTLLECKTYRHYGHSRSDPAKYRPEAEVKAWLARDPLTILGERLATRRLLTQEAQDKLRLEVQALIDESAERAEDAPWPTLEDVLSSVYAN